MGARLQLQIYGASSNFAFDVEGELVPRREIASRPASNAQVATEVRDIWEVNGCRIVSSDGTTATLWTAWRAFMARFESSTFPAYARLVRDPAGANAVVWTLGAADGYEQFRLEAISGRKDEAVEDASWATTATVDLRLSAVKKTPDANGICGFDQTVSTTYSDGLRVLEWRTKITTAEGTDAREKAKSYAVIPVASLGGDHAYETNGPDGIDFVNVDSDERVTRLPTICEAVCRVRQFGIATGVTAPGGSPNDFTYTIETETVGGDTTTTYSAAASGPNALTWVQGKAPLFPSESRVVQEQAANRASGRWVVKSTRSANPDVEGDTNVLVDVELSGGQAGVEFEVTPGGLPVRFDTPPTPLRAVVKLTSEKRGTVAKSEDLKFAGALPAPWIFAPNESTEGQPKRVERATTTGAADLWQRTATLVYYASPLDVVEEPFAILTAAAKPVTSFLVG